MVGTRMRGKGFERAVALRSENGVGSASPNVCREASARIEKYLLFYLYISSNPTCFLVNW